VLYAAKANDAAPVIAALVEAGITKFDVASSVEIERVAVVPNAELYFMNPVKSRGSIRAAYREFGVRSFSFDSEDELDKILDETGQAQDLNLFLRIACPNTHSLIPLEASSMPWRKPPRFLSARRSPASASHHVGSRRSCLPPSAGAAPGQPAHRNSGVLVDAIDIGGGFRRYPHSDPRAFRYAARSPRQDGLP
jgi:ornithine decarboxylase